MRFAELEGDQCRRVQRYLDSSTSNELMVEADLEVLKHLEICEDCSRALDDHARIKGQLKHAVMKVQAPEPLRDRIRFDIRRGRGPAFKITRSWILAAAAAAVVLALVLGVFIRPGADFSISGPRSLSLVAEVAADNIVGQILKVGFDDHVYCAIDHGMANQRFTAGQMSERLGPYERLIELVNERMPRDFEIVVGHRCYYQKREFAHLIMRRQQEVVSLIVTRKNLETFPPTGATVNAAGIDIY